jgi:hypothetical protein
MGLSNRLPAVTKLSPGQVIAVTSAAGAYGGYVIQLAKAEGLTVIADASEKDEKLIESPGAPISSFEGVMTSRRKFANRYCARKASLIKIFQIDRQLRGRMRADGPP